MSIKSGKLRERLRLQEKNLVDNGRGGRKRPEGGPEWRTVVDDIRAEIIPLRGDEAISNSVTRATQLYRVTIRWRPGVTPAQRFDWNGTGLSIITVARSVDRQELVMTCESGTPA